MKEHLLVCGCPLQSWSYSDARLEVGGKQSGFAQSSEKQIQTFLNLCSPGHSVSMVQ